MSKTQCKDCKFFVQHYGLNQRKLFRLNCGHCITIHKMRQKRPDALSCDNFQPGPTDQEAFVSKEYLSKELLHYVLSLDLLPELQDAVVENNNG